MLEYETKMKRVPNVLREYLVETLEIFTFLFPVLFLFMMVSAVPWKFTYLEIGRIVGYNWLTDILVLILVVAIVLSVSFLVSKILKRDTTRAFSVINLAMSFLILCSLILVFMPQISHAREKVDVFVAENANLELQDYVAGVSSFLGENIHSSYNKPEASCEIDEYIYGTLLDRYLLGIWGATRADLIVYQGWGSCGQAAILTEELLLDAKYEARLAHFKGIDHEWAEVKSCGKWLMVDPGYIGNLAEIGSLRTIKPQFQQASGVEVEYRNGTIVDASVEHGY
jgi:hypothetical protein